MQVAHAFLLTSFEGTLRQALDCTQAQDKFLQNFFHCQEEITATSDVSLRSLFEILHEQVTLFNVHLLNIVSEILPDKFRSVLHDMLASAVCNHHYSTCIYRSATMELIDKYAEQCDQFTSRTTVDQFKELCLVSAAVNDVPAHAQKELVVMKLENIWGTCTLKNLTELTAHLRDPGSHLHLLKVEDACTKDECIAAHWLCPTSIVFDLEKTISTAAESLHFVGVKQIVIGRNLSDSSKGFVCV